MVASYLYGIVSVIIIIILLIVGYYLYVKSCREELILKATEGTLKGVPQLGGLYFQHPSMGGDELYEPRDITYHDAIVMYGPIPHGYLYWGITGYVYDIDGHRVFAPIGDSVSRGNVEALSPGDGVAVIFTPNPLMFEDISAILNKEWKQSNGRHPLRIFPIYIPPDMPAKTRYVLLNRIVTRGEEDPIPLFNVRYYTAENAVSVRLPRGCYLKDRSASPKEQDFFKDGEGIFDESIQKALVEMKFQPIAKISVKQHLADIGGLNKGYSDIARECKKGNYIDCDGSNRDITRFVSDVIEVSEGVMIGVNAVDHAASRRATFSAIVFYNADTGQPCNMKITGDVYDKKRNDGKLRTVFLKHLPDCKRVRVEEHIYMEETCDIGPAVSSVLAMRVHTIREVF